MNDEEHSEPLTVDEAHERYAWSDFADLTPVGLVARRSGLIDVRWCGQPCYADVLLEIANGDL